MGEYIRKTAEKVKHLLRTNFHLLFCLILT